VRRLLDIVACTTAFGAKKPEQKPASPDAAAAAAEAAKPGSPGKAAPGGGGGGGGGGGEEPMYPPPKLAQFYDFFTFSHLTPPLHCECSYHSFDAPLASVSEHIWFRFE
jgi:protein TIF31